MINRLLRYWFRKSGWIFTGSIPKRLNQCVFVAGPHTRTQDFYLAQAVMGLTYYRTKVLVDEACFSGLRGFFLKRMGAVSLPADAEEAYKMLADGLDGGGRCSYLFTPHRAGKKSAEFSELFYRLSLDFNLPIVPIGIDHGRKRIKFHIHFVTSIDKQRDLNFLKRFFNSYPIE